jgi:hypothetical protein
MGFGGLLRHRIGLPRDGDDMELTLILSPCHF